MTNEQQIQAKARELAELAWVVGDPLMDDRAVEQIAAALSQIQRETAQACAEIARRGETSGLQLTGIGIANDICERFGIEVPRG